ncbi:MAG: YqgE/AlgH family protein [Tranquillimonas sp.]
MTTPRATVDLSGKLLIAMPGMGDPRFERSVIFVCAHSEDGAMGLVVNKPSPDLTFPRLLEQLSIESGGGGRDIRVYIGGPVENGRGFVLHSSDYASNSSTLEVDDTFGMTATLDILEDIARGRGPGAALLALGYAGWGPGQLEQEIAQNGWLTCDARADIVFSVDDTAKWVAALRSLGVDPVTLSGSAGRA